VHTTRVLTLSLYTDERGKLHMNFNCTEKAQHVSITQMSHRAATDMHLFHNLITFESIVR